MLILGVETSGREGSLALREDERLIDERSLSHQGRRHAQALVKEVDDSLRANSLQSKDVDVVAVSIGPGSFTGLRVGVTFAKTWCYAAGSRLVAVDTLLALAENSPPDTEHAVAVVDAGRGELYVGEFTRSMDGVFQRDGAVRIEPADDVATSRRPFDYVTGPALERYGSLFAGRCRIAPENARTPCADTVAALGRRLAREEHFADVWTLEPFYLRKSAAEEKCERQEAERTRESSEQEKQQREQAAENSDIGPSGV